MFITREDRTEKLQLQPFSPVKRLITLVELYDY